MNNKYDPRIVIDPFSLLVVNTKGELRRIYCPFLVRCVVPIDDLILNHIYTVDMVSIDLSEYIFFSLRGKGYVYKRFEILIN